jgi:hypothetical protein
MGTERTAAAAAASAGAGEEDPKWCRLRNDELTRIVKNMGWVLYSQQVVVSTEWTLPTVARCTDVDIILFVLVSDNCSSGTMIDPGCRGNWVNIASSQAWQDSLTSGDGNVMSCVLLEYLAGCTPNHPTVAELASGFPAYMASSWVGGTCRPPA